MGKHTPTGADREVTVRQLAVPAAKRRHPAGTGAMRRAVVVLAAAGILAGTSTGIASADTNPASTAAHLCHLHPDLPQCSEPVDNNTQGLVDGARAVGSFGFWDYARAVEAAGLDAVIGAARTIRHLF